MKTVAIITARGGSKRIPKKNIKSFLGKPIIAYCIEAALESGIFCDVVVSTDDEEIEKISHQYGATVPFKRSVKNSDDQATTDDVLNEVFKEFKKSGNEYIYACCIYPTAVFTTSEMLISAKQKLQNSKTDLVFACVAYSSPVFRSMKKNEKESFEYVFPEYAKSKTQCLQTYYYDAGQFYFFEVDGFLKRGTLMSEQNHGVILEETQVQDINNLADWKLAEIKYSLFKKL